MSSSTWNDLPSAVGRVDGNEISVVLACSVLTCINF